jgi:uncharacterized protein (DUF1330 family)
MRRRYGTALAIVAAFAVGALTVQGLHAQAKKTTLYSIAEIDLKNPDGYVKDYAPKAQAVIKKNGGRILAAGGKVTTVEGQPAKARVVIQAWDSAEQYQAYRNSAEWKEVRKLGDKYASFRTITVEGVPQ